MKNVPDRPAQAWSLVAALALLAIAHPASASTIQIMPLGDSITWGYPGLNQPADPGGYRGRLYNDLTAAGLNVQMVGSTNENSTGLPAAAQYHEGHIGYGVSDSTTLIPSLNNNISTWLGPTGTHPDIVLLMAGTNNIIGNYEYQQAPYQLGALVRRISELDPKATILVSTLLPLANPALEAEVQTFNARISGPDGVIASVRKTGVKTELVDLGSLLTTADLADGIHPNPTGYTKLAAGWAAAIEGIGGAGGAPEPSTCWVVGLGVVAFLATSARKRSLARLSVILLACACMNAQASASVLQIMPLGDSITYGYEGANVPADPGGYRTTLYQDLTAAGYHVQLVGSETANPPLGLPAAADGQEGHVGYVIADQSSPGGSLADHVAQWVGPKAAMPDVVLLMIGANNIDLNHDVQQAPYQLAALVKRITELDPKATVLVSTLSPIDVPVYNQEVQAFNARLSGPDGVVASLRKSGVKVELVNVGGLLTTSDLIDGLHPSPEGYVKLGHAWASAVEGLGGAGGAPEPSTLAILGGGMSGFLGYARLRARRDEA
jgi:lysophospholipase L1-like esterase